MAQIDGARQQDTNNEDAEALQAALAQRQVTLQGQSCARMLVTGGASITVACAFSGVRVVRRLDERAAKPTKQ